MDLTKSTDEMLDDLCRVVYEKLYGTGSKGLDAYLTAISEELDERNIQHVTNKKCMDKHREKYFKIDVLIPPLERFIMLKHRKHMTRSDMNQFRQQETSVGVKGLLVNFYNGVDVREATSLLPGEEKRELAKKNPRLKGGLSGPRSSSVDKLPGIGSDRRRYGGSRSWGGSSSQVAQPQASQQISSTPATANVDFSRIFAASCASFFISEGDRTTFASSFNDFLTLMSIKRITFPRKHLVGPLLEKPEGVLNENLEHFFATSSIASSLRKKTPDDDSGRSNPPTSPTETRGGSVVSSSAYRRLPAIGSSSPPPPRKSGQFHVATLGLPSIKRPPPPLDVVRVFAAACASFFLTEGDLEEFIFVFADFLRTITAPPNQFGMRYTSKYNRRDKEEEVTDDVDQFKLPSKRILRNLRTALIGDEVEGLPSELDKTSLMTVSAE